MSPFAKVALTCFALAILLVVNRALALWKNYNAAKNINLPIIVRLGSWQDPLWMIFGPSIKGFFCRLGLWDAKATDYSAFGWPLKDHYATHQRLGPAFTLVTPFKNNVLIADVGAARAIYKDWRSWVKDPMLYSMMEAFGRNVTTVNGNDWQRHRKVTAPAFKEANSKLVWKASLAQAQGAEAKWATLSTDRLHKNGVTLGQLRTDTSAIAMHVLSYAGMGKEYSFGHGVEKAEPGAEMSYANAMHTVISNISPMLVPLTFAAAKLPSSIVPTWLKQLQIAVRSVRKSLGEAVAAERLELANGKTASDNLLSTLVRANEEEKGLGSEGEKRLALDDEELYGNLFMFNQAGYETTSGALSSAIPLLAMHPDVQEWVREEVDAVFADVDQNSYGDAFPRLVRCEALMYETLRFFAVVPFHPKYTGNEARTIQIRGTNHIIPAHTYVSIHIVGIHFDPSTWGSDVESFNPRRFVKDPDGKGAGHEVFASAPEGTEFMAFAWGPRVCPGKRFSTVEFVSVVSEILRGYNVRPASVAGETGTEAMKRLEECVFDIEFAITPHYVRPDDAGVVFEGREK